MPSRLDLLRDRASERQDLCRLVRMTIVDRLDLPVDAGWITDDQPLVRRGLELDGVDRLEVAFGLEALFGVRIDPGELGSFASAARLAERIAAGRPAAGPGCRVTGSCDPGYAALRTGAARLPAEGGVVAVRGEAALAFAQRVLARDLGDLAPGRCAPSLVLDDDARLVATVIVYHRGDHLWLEARAPDALVRHLDALAPAGVAVACADGRVVAVEGPRARDAVRHVLGRDAVGIPAGAVVETAWRDEPVVVARTGWSGEDAYRLVSPGPDVAEALAEWAVPAGPRVLATAARELGPAGEGPVDAGWGWLVDPAKPAFVGREALVRGLAAGPGLRPLALASATAPTGAAAGQAAVRAGGVAVGEVVSSGYSPGLGAHLSVARVEPALAAAGLDLELSGSVAARSLAAPYVVPESWRRA